MYPDLLPALARARQEDLLRQREFREQARHATSRPDVPRQPEFRPFLQSRVRVGTLLIRAGSRLSQPRQTGFDLVHK
jgi:hypothetical protein